MRRIRYGSLITLHLGVVNIVEEKFVGVLMIRCPNRGHDISTGIEIKVDEIHKLPNIRTFTHCPRCGMSHGWTAKDAWVIDDPRNPKRAML